VEIPAHEIDTFVLTATEAVDLAAAGEIQNGFRCLAGGLGLAQEAEADGEVWGWQLVKLYREALDRYTSGYGARLLAGGPVSPMDDLMAPAVLASPPSTEDPTDLRTGYRRPANQSCLRTQSRWSQRSLH
jgi:hypothetical protein